MKTSQIVLAGVVVAAGIGAAVYMGSKPAAPSTPKVDVAKAPSAAVAPAAAATDEAAPVAPDAPKGAGGAGPVGMAMGATEAQIAARPKDPALGAMHSSEDIQTAVAKMVELAGGEAKMRPLLAAKWKLTLSAMNRTIFVEMTTDTKGTVAVRDEQSGSVRYRSGHECRVQRGEEVLACRRADRLLMAALYAGERAVLPLRFAKEKPKETREDDGGYFELEDGELDLMGLWRVDRQNGVIDQVGPTPWAELQFENHADFAGIQMPSVWMLRADLSPPGKTKASAGLPPVGARHPSVMSIRVQSVVASNPKTTITLPALTTARPLRLDGQSERKVIAKVVNNVEKIGEVIEEIVGQVPFELMLDAEPMAAVAAPVLPISPGRTAEARVLFPADLLLPSALAAKVTTLPADANVVRVVRKINAGDLNDQLALAYAEVKAAGYEFGTERVVIRPLSDQLEHEMLVELQIPVKAKDAK